MIRFSLLILLSSAGVLWGQSTRPDLTGTWKYDASRSSVKHSKVSEQTWKIECGKDKIQFAETVQAEGKETSRTWDCSTMGKECQVDDGGTQAKISMFYNGPALMEFRTRGEDVLRRSYTVKDDGKSLEVEITYITPQKESEKLVLAKVK